MAKANLTPEQNLAVSTLVTRLLEKFKQSEIAEACGLSQSTVSLLKLGKQGTTATVALKLAEFAGVDPSTLLGADWRKFAEGDALPSVEGARTLGFSQGYDRQWVNDWTPNVARPETLSAAECWTLMQADWIIRTHEGQDEEARHLRDLMGRINSAVSEVFTQLDAEVRELRAKKR